MPPNFTYGEEEYRPVYNDRPLPTLSFGLPFPTACHKHTVERLKCQRIFIIASKSLSLKTDALTKLQDALGKHVAGTYIGVGSHTPIAEVVQVIDQILTIPDGIDCLVTLGGGSITDAGKLVRFALANSAFNEAEIDTLWGGHSFNPNQCQNLKPPTDLPLVHIPITLSGGEYQHIAGATDTKSHAKHTFEPKVNPTLVIQDPELCLNTPAWLWLSSGIRAVDHCIETLCSLQSNPTGDSEAKKGLSKLVPGLLRCKNNAKDLQAIHLCQQGVVEAMAAVSSGVPLGASHAIGHQLGPLGVGHGETSCILLPAVCKYNAAKGANNDRQTICRDLLLKDAVVQETLKSKGISNPDLGDILDIVIRELGMPRTLREVNVGRDQFEKLAQNSLHDLWIKTNAVPITEMEQVMEILEAVAG